MDALPIALRLRLEDFKLAIALEAERILLEESPALAGADFRGDLILAGAHICAAWVRRPSARLVHLRLPTPDPDPEPKE